MTSHSHRDMEEWFLDYIEGTLDEARRDAIEHAVATDPLFARSLEEYRELLTCEAELAGREFPSDSALTDRIMAELPINEYPRWSLGELLRRGWDFLREPPRRVVGAAATVVIVMLVLKLGTSTYRDAANVIVDRAHEQHPASPAQPALSKDRAIRAEPSAAQAIPYERGIADQMVEVAPQEDAATLFQEDEQVSPLANQEATAPIREESLALYPEREAERNQGNMAAGSEGSVERNRVPSLESAPATLEKQTVAKGASPKLGDGETAVRSASDDQESRLELSPSGSLAMRNAVTGEALQRGDGSQGEGESGAQVRAIAESLRRGVLPAPESIDFEGFISYFLPLTTHDSEPILFEFGTSPIRRGAKLLLLRITSPGDRAPALGIMAQPTLEIEFRSDLVTGARLIGERRERLIFREALVRPHSNSGRAVLRLFQYVPRERSPSASPSGKIDVSPAVLRIRDARTMRSDEAQPIALLLEQSKKTTDLDLPLVAKAAYFAEALLNRPSAPLSSEMLSSLLSIQPPDVDRRKNQELDALIRAVAVLE